MTPAQRAEYLLKKAKPKADCLIFAGKSRTPNGYGISWDGKRTVLIHRYIYSSLVAEIPADKIVMHSCDVRDCINPDHLKLGTFSDNTQDMLSKNRGRNGYVCY